MKAQFYEAQRLKSDWKPFEYCLFAIAKYLCRYPMICVLVNIFSLITFSRTKDNCVEICNFLILATLKLYRRMFCLR